MKNTDIIKIRQLLKQARKWIMEEGGVICPHKFGGCKHDNENCPIFCLDHALALLPRSTCNGTKEEIVETFINHTSGNKIGVLGPCPDCQPKSCVCCEEITEENAHLHRNCGK